MVDNVNSQGVQQDDSELNDPGNDINAPDPLLGEQAQSGALSAVAPKGTPTQAQARQKASDRYDENEQEMTSLRQQYALTAKQQSDQYAQQKKILDDATNRLMNMPVGPSDQEARYRIGSASGPGSFNVGNVNAARAEILKEQREQELQKQQLIAQYQGSAIQSGIGQSNARLNQITQQERIAQSGLNSSGNQQFRGQSNLPWYVKDDGKGGYYLPPGAEKIMDSQALSKLFGRFTLLPQPDGSRKIVTLGGVGAAGQAAVNAPTAPPQAPPAPRPAAPQPGSAPAPGGGSAPVANAAPASVPPPQNAGPKPAVAVVPPPVQAPPRQATDPFNDLFMPSTVLDPKYGALTAATKPAYVATAHQAFDPSYFQNYAWKATHYDDLPIRTTQVKDESKEYSAAANAASQTIYNYGQALHNIDAMGNDEALRTGPAGARISAFENTIRGVLGNDAAAAITNDPDLKKLATQQDTDKYFRLAAQTGLKAIFGGRISNMEVKLRMESLPGNQLLPAVTRMLAQAQAEVAQDTINKNKLFGQYVRHNGDVSPGTFDTWYEANFSPFHDSRLKQNLAQMQKPALPDQGPQMQSLPPLVAYYKQLAEWQANPSPNKGPAPVKPGAQTVAKATP